MQFFIPQSKKLMGILDEDRKEYLKEFKHHSDNFSKARVRRISKSSTPFKVVGFIYSMIRMVLEEHSNCKGTKNSAILQTAIQSIKFRPMTVSEGRLAMSKLLENIQDRGQFSFPIFFDECGYKKAM